MSLLVWQIKGFPAGTIVFAKGLIKIRPCMPRGLLTGGGRRRGVVFGEHTGLCRGDRKSGVLCGEFGDEELAADTRGFGFGRDALAAVCFFGVCGCGILAFSFAFFGELIGLMLAALFFVFFGELIGLMLAADTLAVALGVLGFLLGTAILASSVVSGGEAGASSVLASFCCNDPEVKDGIQFGFGVCI